MTKPSILQLNILLHDLIIGTLTLLPNDQTIFAFNQAYINNPERPTLSLSFKDLEGNLITNVKPARMKVQPFFSNLLPEGHLREYLATQAGVASSREFYLLWVLGQDLPGAITIEPADKQSWPPNSDNKSPSKHQHAMRFSLAGVQLKFSAVAERTGGLTIPAEGVGGSWILKLPSFRFESVPENEYSMMTLARLMGMDIPEVKLVTLDKIANLPDNIGIMKGQALAVKRFDRTENGDKIHIEDFAQIFKIYPTEKYSRGNYKNIAQVLSAETGEKDIVEFTRRLVFNTLIGNADMHLKNWSMIYPDGKTAGLAPGYDFVSTIAYLKDDDMALKYVNSKRRDSLSLETLAHLSEKASLSERIVIRAAKETVEQFNKIWESEKRHLPLSDQVISAIEKNVKNIPLVKEI